MKATATLAELKVSSELIEKSSKSDSASGISGKILKNTYFYDGEVLSNKKSAGDVENRTVAEFKINDLISQLVASKEAADKCLKEDFYFYGGGWQSWGFGGEVAPGQFEKKYIPVIPQWKAYYSFPGKAPSKAAGKSTSSKKILNGKFISYLRWNNTYLVIASTGNVPSSADEYKVLPPVEFYINRRKRVLSVVSCSQGKKWKKNETVAELSIFAVSSFFELKAVVNELYAGTEAARNRFENLKFLSSETDKIVAAGWESWYNHYANINQTLIEEDLESLGKTENIIKTFCSDKNKPVVFQVDDGWEQGLGQWECDEKKFPMGMVKLSASIAEKGYIPGLWLAPFIIDFRTDFCQKHLDWLLKDENGKYVEAGFSFPWGDGFGKMQPGKPFSYFCLDLSREDVVEYLDDLMDKVINQWGFRYLKLDFLFAGMLYGKFANEGASYEWYDRAMKILTKRNVNNKGERVAYLGCGIPLEPSFNYFPLSRMGSDTTENWDMSSMRPFHFYCRPSAVVNMQDTLGHAFWDQSVYINDPDVIFLRYDNITMSDKQKETVALVNYLFASQLMHSDDPSAFKPDTEGKFTQHIMELYEKFQGEEFAQKNLTSEVYVMFSRSNKYCGIINLSDKPYALESKKMLEQCNMSENTALNPVVGHYGFSNNVYTTEAHSINIFEVK